jgi:hypothetical protein
VIDQEPPVAAKDTKRLLYLPPSWLDLEAGLVLAPDQLQLEGYGGSWVTTV